MMPVLGEGLSGFGSEIEPEIGGSENIALKPGWLTVAIEEATRIVIVRGYGLWTVAQIEAHLRDYRAALDRLRLMQSDARVIVDLREAGIQSAAVGTALNSGTKICHREGDRIAMIVATSLSRIQMRRVLDSDLHGYFVSEDAARNWLAETLVN